MPLDICDPCCSPSSWARKIETYRQAELIILCQILEAVQGGGGADQFVRIDGADTTSGFLDDKLVAGTNISFVINNVGANETLTINSTGGGTPAAPDTSVQYNDGGAFGGDATFTFDEVTKLLHVDKFAVDIGDGTQGIVHIDHNGSDRVLFYSVSDTTAGNSTYLPSFWSANKNSDPAGDVTFTQNSVQTNYVASNATSGTFDGVVNSYEIVTRIFNGGGTWDPGNTWAVVGGEALAQLANVGGAFNSDINLISWIFREPIINGAGTVGGTAQSLAALFEGHIQLNTQRRFYLGGSYSEPNLTLGDTFFEFLGVSPNAEISWVIEGVSSVLRMRSEKILFGGASEAHCIGGFADFTVPDVAGVDQTFRNHVYNGGVTTDGPLRNSSIYSEVFSNTNAAGAEVVSIIGKAQSNFAFPSTGVRGFGTGTLGDNYGIQGIAVTASAGDNFGVYGLAANGANSYGIYSDGDAFVDGKLTVTGGIDPTFLELNGLDTNTYLNMTDGQNVAVSAADEGRLRYNTALQIFQKSEDGAAWAPLSGTGAPSAPAASIQYNDGGAFGGSANFTFDETNVIITLDSAADTIPEIRTPDGSGINFGKGLTFRTGAGDTNDPGGLLQLIAGDGDGTGNGGGVELYAGDSGTGATGSGGTLVLFAGNATSTNGSGGSVDIHAGISAGTLTGGHVEIFGGDASGATGTAGRIQIDAGLANGGTPNRIDIGVDEASEVNIGRTAGEIGFYGAAAVVQAGAVTPPAGGGTIDTEARTAINAIITALQNIGVTA